MTDTSPAPAEPRIDPPRRTARLSAVWLVPLFALLLAGWLTYRHYAEQGPEITIRFATAEGLEAGVTRIRYKEVEIGEVTRITLIPDLSGVTVTARMVKSTIPWLTHKTRFWVVRPRVGLSGVSGLGTLMSGAYIQADVVTEGRVQHHFQGLEAPPQTEAGAPGLRLTLHAEQAGSVNIGSPVYYRQMPVGQVEARRFAKDDQGVEFEIFIHAPHHTRITTRTRFWNVSGIQATLSSEGVKLQTETLESLLAGGIAFGNVSADGDKVAENDALFTLYANELTAREQVFAERISTRLNYALYFQESVRGLKAGAPVEYLGVPVGRVTEVNLRYDKALGNAYIPVYIELEPERMGNITVLDDYQALIQNAVTQGMRAQLQTGNLVTGQLYIALRMMDDAAPVSLRPNSVYPEIPTISSELNLLTEKANSAIDKFLALPVEALLADINRTVKDADALLTQPETLALAANLNLTLRELRTTLDNLDQSLAYFDGLTRNSDTALATANEVLNGVSPESPLYFELTTTLRAVQEAARSVETLAGALERNPRALILGQ